MNPLEVGVSRWINQKYNIQVSSSWVKACIRWIIEENREVCCKFVFFVTQFVFVLHAGSYLLRSSRYYIIQITD